jgi:phospholipid-translocating P-type ATPase (flippase)
LQDIINDISHNDENLLSFDFRGKSFKNQSEMIYEFWLVIVLCNDIVTDKSQSKLTYLSSSPDEIALIEAAKNYGFEFLERNSQGIKVKIEGILKTFEILAVNEFTSERKRMSVLIKDRETNQTKLLIKGADEALMKIMDHSIDNPFLDKLNQSLVHFAEQGLRTLDIGFKHFEDDKEWQDWLDRYLQVKCSHAEDQQVRLEALAEEIEEGIALIGVTAVEDQLQKSVARAIQEFNEAKIHVWMITGDKLETAENIAFSCNLISRNWHIFHIRHSNDIQGQLTRIRQEISTNELMKNHVYIGLVIEGDALSVAIEKEKELFYKICKAAQGVVCCRANPMQKAKVVRFIRKMDPNAKTLAIGDGGNDVTMIQTAHVGVGIYGKEGHQAANSSDFSIAEFRFLRQLMFVHGRWNSRRIGFFILYFFFKNLAFTLVQGYFAFISGFSAQTVWDDWYLLLFNSAITAAGITCYSLWEQDLNYRQDRVVELFWPILYISNREDLPLTLGKYFFFMIWGITSSLVVFFICKESFHGILNSEGHTEVFWDLSTCMYSSIVFIVAIVLIIKMKYWSWIQHLTIWVLGFALYCPLFMLIYDQVPGTYVYSNTLDFLSLPIFYLSGGLCVAVCTIPFYAGYLYLELFHPKDSDKVFQNRIKVDPKLEEMNNSEKLDTLHSTNYTNKMRSRGYRK